MNTNQCGIYKITNVVTGDFYIGSACNLRRRLYMHRWMLANNRHDNCHLQRAWNKYGEDNFEFTIILLCDVENKLYYEQVLLDGLNPAYNIATCAEASQQGLHPSEATRAKLRGRRHTDAARLKMSEARIGRVFSEEHKRRLSAALIGNTRGLGNTNVRGHTLTEEHKRKLSEAHMGKHFSEERKRNMSEAQKRRRAKLLT